MHVLSDLAWPTVVWWFWDHFLSSKPPRSSQLLGPEVPQLFLPPLKSPFPQSLQDPLWVKHSSFTGNYPKCLVQDLHLWAQLWGCSVRAVCLHRGSDALMHLAAQYGWFNEREVWGLMLASLSSWVFFTSPPCVSVCCEGREVTTGKLALWGGSEEGPRRPAGLGAHVVL